jgi:prophage regulatory protein
MDRVGLKKTAIYRRIKDGTFPAPRRPYGGPAVAWLESDIDAWMSARIEGDQPC